MSAAATIARLDRALSKFGQTVTIARRIGTSAVLDELADVPAKILGPTSRAVRSNEQLAGSVTQQDRVIVISQTQINAAGWPATAGGHPWLLKNDIVVIGSIRYTVQLSTATERDGVVVRIDAIARGGGAA